MEYNKLSFYIFILLFGSIGNVTVLLCCIMMLEEQNSKAYLVALGFIFLTIYINNLEKKAGISSKLLWIKAVYQSF